jgi:hypothetical protein
MGKPERIGETREASSETGSGAKTQGRAPRKPLMQRISGPFDRAIKAQTGHNPRMGEKPS